MLDLLLTDAFVVGEIPSTSLRMTPQIRMRPQLGGDLGQYVHPLDLGCDAEVLAGALLDSQYAGMAAYPALLPGSQLRREN